MFSKIAYALVNQRRRPIQLNVTDLPKHRIKGLRLSHVTYYWLLRLSLKGTCDTGYDSLRFTLSVRVCRCPWLPLNTRQYLNGS